MSDKPTLKSILSRMAGRWSLSREDRRQLRAAVHAEIERAFEAYSDLEAIELAASVLHCDRCGMPASTTTPEIERQLLGSMLLDPAVVDEALKLVAREHLAGAFTLEVYDAIAGLRAAGMPADIALVTDKLRAAHQVAVPAASDREGMPQVEAAVPYSPAADLVELLSTVAVAGHWKFYARRIREAWLERRRYEVAMRLTSDAIGQAEIVAWMTAAKEMLTKLAADVRAMRVDFGLGNGNGNGKGAVSS